MIDPAVIDALVASLTDPSRSHPPGQFPSDQVAAARPGLYSWWADQEARYVIGLELRAEIGALILCGPGGGHPAAFKDTQQGDVAKSYQAEPHKRNAYSSTFRLTLSAVLLEPLGLLVMKPRRLTPESRAEVSAWIRRHLRVAIAPFDDRDNLSQVEHAVLDVLDPPLNLDGCSPTPARRRLRAMRARITNPTDGARAPGLPT